MNCRKARSSLEELFDDERAPHHIHGLQEHLDTCPTCREWHELECRVVDALEQLDRFPMPPGFTARILDQLPDSVPEPRSRRAAQIAVWADGAKRALDSIVEGLTRRSHRRRLVPILAAAAVGVLMLGLLYAQVGNESTTTAGAATGRSPWAIAGGVLAAIVVILVALAWRRWKK
jgi:hypothetical protein